MGRRTNAEISRQRERLFSLLTELKKKPFISPRQCRYSYYSDIDRKLHCGKCGGRLCRLKDFCNCPKKERYTIQDIL